MDRLTVVAATRSGLLRYAGTRILVAACQVVLVVVAVFVIVSLLPGDAAVTIAGDDPDPQRIAALRAELGLDRPLPERLSQWLTGLLHGDAGTSLISDRPVADMIGDALAPTLTLAVLALIVIFPASLTLGVLAAVHRGGRVDRAVTTTATAVYAVPEFAIAVLSVALFAVAVEWLPATAIGATDNLAAHPEVLLLPILVLVARPICSSTRLIRTTLAETLDSEFVDHVRGLGVSPRRVLLRHALPMSLAPTIQQWARITDWLLGGVVIVEAVFAIGGVGQLTVDAIRSRDLPLMLGVMTLFAVVTMAVNLLSDVLVYVVSPRSRDGL